MKLPKLGHRRSAVVLATALSLSACTANTDGSPGFGDPSGEAGESGSAAGGSSSGSPSSTGGSVGGDDGSSGGVGDSGGEDTDDPLPEPGGACSETAWIGVPDAPFGIHDSHQMYAGQAGYQDGPNGPYTGWVDNTHPACSDAGPGTESAPRCSIPNSLSAGEVVEVHGGPYRLTMQATTLALQGSAEQPVWLRAVGDVEIDAGGGENRHWAAEGTYYAIEGFTFVGGATVRGMGDHYALRHNEVDFGARNCVNVGGSFGVVFDNDLHHCHRQPGPQDAHGVQVGPGSSNMWVVANEIHHNFGNGIQWGHGAQANPADLVYIAGNTIHHDRETGISSKWSARSVISCNEVYGYAPSPADVEWCAEDGSYCNTPESGSAGQAIIQGSDGFPESEWVLFNEIHDTNSCFRLEEATRANYVGNLCYETAGPGVRLEKLGHDTHFLHNTMHHIGTDGGQAVVQQDWRDAFENMHIANNVFSEPGGLLLWFEDFSVVTPTMIYESNVHYAGGGPIEMDWRGRQSVSSSQELEALMGSDVASFSGNEIADPQLADPDALDFTPASGSPLVGAATNALAELDADFRALFGTDVTLIPSCWDDGEFDIGARCAP